MEHFFAGTDTCTFASWGTNYHELTSFPSLHFTKFSVWIVCYFLLCLEKGNRFCPQKIGAELNVFCYSYKQAVEISTAALVITEGIVGDGRDEPFLRYLWLCLFTNQKIILKITQSSCNKTVYWLYENLLSYCTGARPLISIYDQYALPSSKRACYFPHLLSCMLIQNKEKATAVWLLGKCVF